MRQPSYDNPSTIPYIPKRDARMLTTPYLPQNDGQAYVRLTPRLYEKIRYSLPSLNIDTHYNEYIDQEHDCISIPLGVYATAIMQDGNPVSPKWHIDIVEAEDSQVSASTTKMFHASAYRVYLYLVDCCRKTNTRGVLRDVDLDDLVTATSLCIDTVRSALEILHNQHILHQHIHESDRKLIDLWMIGYSECTRRRSEGYIQLTGEEFTSLYRLNSSLKLVVGLHLLSIADAAVAHNQTPEVMIHTLIQRLPDYIRPYMIRDLLHESDMRELFDFLVESRTEKPLHQKTLTRYKIIFHRIIGDVKDMMARLRELYFLRAAKYYHNISAHIIQACADLIQSYDPDTVLEAIHHMTHLDSYQTGKIKSPVNYVSSLIRQGDF